jgi:hypothetical protein
MIGLVAGFGRCGSSLVMAMLKAGGLPVVGSPPIYESAEFTPHFTSESFLKRKAGSILKWLDPTHTVLPASVRGGPIIWLDRDPSAWAESHMKVRNLWHNSPLRKDDPATHASLVKEVSDRTRDVLPRIDGYGPLRRLRFEDVLARPMNAAEALAEHFRDFGNLDTDAAARVVRPRSPACEPEMEFDQDSALACLHRTRLEA